MKTRLVVVEDHRLVAEALAALFGTMVGVEFVGVAHTGAAAWPLIIEQKPDVAVVDLGLPDVDGIELIRRLRTTSTRVLVLSGRTEAAFAEEALRAGALAFVVKAAPREDFLAALSAVTAGETWLSPSLARTIARRQVLAGRGAPPQGMDALTDREREVFGLIGRGASLSEISKQLGVSKKTVETHRQHMRSKLEVASATELTAYAARWLALHTDE